MFAVIFHWDVNALRSENPQNSVLRLEHSEGIGPRQPVAIVYFTTRVSEWATEGTNFPFVLCGEIVYHTGLQMYVVLASILLCDDYNNKMYWIHLVEFLFNCIRPI